MSAFYIFLLVLYDIQFRYQQDTVTSLEDLNISNPCIWDPEDCTDYHVTKGLFKKGPQIASS